MGGRYYTRATKLAGLVEIAAERGADIDALLREAGLNPAVLRSPETAIDYGGFCELLRRCAVAWDMPDIGLRMIRHQQIDFLGPVALVTRMERTVRGALRAIIANLVIHANATVAAFEEADGDAASLILNQRDDAPQCRENTELVMAQGKLVVDSIAGAPVPLVEAAFVHDKGRSSRAVEAHFACPIRYGAERNALTFDRALLDRRTEKSDLAYHALIKKYLTTARAELEGAGISEAVRAEIARQMELGHCTLESVADSLRMPPRSLQRRLQAERLCFRSLLDEWRRARALSLVTNTRLPLSEVSEALGYSEQSVFTEAFRRWYGGTPHRFRTERLAAGG